MNEIKCIFCATKSDRIAIKENGYQGKQCPDCGLIYISPRPSLQEVIDLYGHDEAHIPADSHIADDFAKRLYAKHHLKIINQATKGGSLLEIGAGAGYFLDEARKVGFEPYGLEFNPTQASYVRDQLNIPCEQSPLSESVFNGKQFDVVYHCDVISHLFDPIADFQEMNRRLKDDSYLVFETGNLGEVNPEYLEQIDCFQYPDHLFFFNTKNLKKLLEQTGFELIKIHRYSIAPQLKTKKTLSKFKHALKRVIKPKPKAIVHHDQSSTPVNLKTHNVTANAGTKQSGFKSQLKDAYLYAHRYFIYWLRYQIGKIAPKQARPQTVIVVAKKISAV